MAFSGAALSDDVKPQTTAPKAIESFPQNIVAASPRKITTINAFAARAQDFVATYLPDVSNPSLKDFDEAFYRWQKTKDRRYTDQQVIGILGAYLGNRLVTDFQMEWVIVTDQYGSDYAVKARKSKVIAYSFASVSKRVERNQYEFMDGIYQAVKRLIAKADS